MARWQALHLAEGVVLISKLGDGAGVAIGAVRKLRSGKCGMYVQGDAVEIHRAVVSTLSTAALNSV